MSDGQSEIVHGQRGLQRERIRRALAHLDRITDTLGWSNHVPRGPDEQPTSLPSIVRWCLREIEMANEGRGDW